MSQSLIVFSGVDGAGKSTQIDLLTKHLRQRGRRVHVLWGRGGYTPGMMLLKRILRRLLNKDHMPPPGPSAQRTAALSSSRVRWWWQTLAMIDFAAYYGVWARLQLWLGYVVICDRYIADTRLDFELNFPGDQVPRRALWKWVENVCPQPTCTFLLLVPVAESQRRSAAKNEPFPDDESTMHLRLAYYESLVRKDDNFHALDSMRSIESVAAEISDRIDRPGQCEVACR